MVKKLLSAPVTYKGKTMFITSTAVALQDTQQDPTLAPAITPPGAAGA